MELKRKIISELEQWRANNHKVALLVKGARQVGKTTTIRHFGQRNYASFVEINFEQSPQAKKAFEGNLDAATIIQNLSLMGYGPFIPQQTLVFFDEIQSCPQARTAIKFLVEDGRFDYIESGSLLGINYKEVSSYPVGFEQQVEMYPLDFEEFLWAGNVGEEVISRCKDAYTSMNALPDLMHDNLMQWFRRFLIVGGMPRVVCTYLENPDFAATLREQRLILANYRDDIAKYAYTKKARAKQFFDSVPSQLSQPNKRFIYEQLNTNARSRDYEDAAQWLSDAGICLFCYNTNKIELPFAFTEKRNIYKVYMLDTGLLCASWKEPIQLQVMQGDLQINEGALVENFVASELVKHGHTLHYYDRKSRQELDFVIENQNKISPIEVKSGNDYLIHVSLNKILQEHTDRICRPVVLCKSNIARQDGISYIPIYLAGEL
ncbi:MAG: ATP-binding protein [Bacteroidales bacterium]|nr:ATP-binding protein [Bacteroidales bacterium]